MTQRRIVDDLSITVERLLVADQCPATGRGDRLGRRPMQKA
jgi:hypothetical protein